MAETPRSSFIPKQTQSAVPSSVRKKKRFHVFGFISSVILIGSLVLAGGAFFYKDYAHTQLEAEKANLSAEKEKFNESEIAEVRSFERRLMAVRFLLENHISPSKIFDALELSTMRNIQFTSFALDQRPSQDVTLAIQGGTEEFKTAALQALEFAKNPLLKDAVFTDLGTSGATLEEIESGQGTLLDSGYRVNFSVTGNITSGLLAFDGDTSATTDEAPNQQTQENTAADMTDQTESTNVTGDNAQ